MKISIRKRFYATAGVVATLGFLILAATLYYARTLADDTRRLEAASFHRAKLLAVAAEALQYVRDGGEERLKSIRADLDSFEAALDTLEMGGGQGGLAPATDRETLAALERVREAFRRYRQTLAGDLETWAELDALEVSAPYRGLVVERALNVEAAMGEVTAALAAEAHKSLANLNMAQMFAVLGLVILLAASVFEVNRHVLAPMPLMARALHSVAAGNLKARVHLASDSEFSRVADAFNSMVKELSKAREIIGQKQVEIEAKNAELERASRMKSEFLATMSHELRTPMNAIMGYTSLMRRGIYGETTDEQKKGLAGIAETSSALLGLINDVLDITKVEAGLISLNRAAFDANDLARDLIETMEPLALAKNLQMRASPAPNSVRLTSDRARVRQILLNLLGNAVKFTEKGSVVLRVEESGSGVDFSVSDTGIGVRPEDHEIIFETFRQLDASDTRSQGGTGLGLSISRKLARALGGDVTVRSARGEGATFVLSLPLISPPAGEPDPARPAPSVKAVAPEMDGHSAPATPRSTP